MMKIFDKAKWHIDAGENEKVVINRIKTVFEFLDKNGLLTDEGKEMLEIGIDDSISLNEKMVTKKGYDFLEKHYDEIIGLLDDELVQKLESLYSVF